MIFTSSARMPVHQPRTGEPRELTGVLGHEIAHIANEDLRVMGLADSISRLTHLLALLGQIMLLFSLPALLWGTVAIQWPALLLLAVSPQLALLGLSRVHEFDADRLPTGIGFGARQDRAGESRLAAARMGQPGTLLVAHASGDDRAHPTLAGIG